MLAKFTRNRKRKSHTTFGTVFRHDFKRQHSSLSQRRRWSLIPMDRSTASDASPSIREDQQRLVTIDEFVESAIRIEAEALLSDKNPCSRSELAAALLSSQTIMQLQENSHDLASRMQRLSLKRQSRQTSLKKALHELACSVDSDAELISSWSEAKLVLSHVLAFPDASTKLEPKQAPTLDEYRERLKNATLLQRLKSNFVAGRNHFLQPANSIVPPRLTTEPEVAFEGEKPRGAIEQSDENLQRQIEEREKERREQLENEAVRQLEERMKESERREQAEQLASSLLRDLTPEEQEIVRAAMYGVGPRDEVLAQAGTDSVRRESMQRLQPGKWLNDEVIHYFLLMLAKRDEVMCQEDPSRKRSHFFKSFFITKLLNEGHDDPAMDGKYDYTNVKRWSKRAPGKDIFNLDKIIFPINEGQSHWICAVAFMQEKRIQIYDSMGSDWMHYLKHIFHYLQDEHQAKKGESLPALDEWKLIPCTSDTPNQRNGYDCGVFTCMFADFVSKDCPLLFSQEHVTQCRDRIALSIMKGAAIM